MASTVAIWGQSCCSTPSSETPGAAIMQWSMISMSCERCLRRPTRPSASMAYWTRVRQAGTSPAGSLSPSAGMTVPSQPASSGVRPARRWSCSAMTSPLRRRWAPGLACCQSQPPHLPGPANGQGALTRSLDASMISTASARRKRESSAPAVTRATTFSPGRVWRTNSTRPSSVRAMQWPPCATGPTSTSYSRPISDSGCVSPVCGDVDSFCMRGWLQRGKGDGPRPDDNNLRVYVGVVRPPTTRGVPRLSPSVSAPSACVPPGPGAPSPGRSSRRACGRASSRPRRTPAGTGPR